MCHINCAIPLVFCGQDDDVRIILHGDYNSGECRPMVGNRFRQGLAIQRIDHMVMVFIVKLDLHQKGQWKYERSAI